MSCYLCGRPFEWVGPSPVTGRVQGWRRLYDPTPKGRRCSDRNACRNAATAAQGTLFEVAT